jgi:hypothetical protein
MIELTTSAPKTLLISNNMVEVDDLTEMLVEQGLGPVIHTRDLEGTARVLAETGETLRLLICGLSMHLHEVKEFLASRDLSTVSLVVIDGTAEFLDQEGAAILQRPFSTADVLAAFARIGLRD